MLKFHRSRHYISQIYNDDIWILPWFHNFVYFTLFSSLHSSLSKAFAQKAKSSFSEKISALCILTFLLPSFPFAHSLIPSPSPIYYSFHYWIPSPSPNIYSFHYWIPFPSSNIYSFHYWISSPSPNIYSFHYWIPSPSPNICILY